MKLYHTIVSTCVLLLLALPLSVFAMGSEAQLNAIISSAESAVAATPSWKNASSSERQRLTEVTVRAAIISTVRNRFDRSQMEVDRKIEEVVETAMGKVGDKTILTLNKERIRELFIEEWYKYMYLNKSSNIESPYIRARGSELGAERILSNVYRGQKLVKNEIGEVLEQINGRISEAVDSHGIEDLKQEIFKQFNLLR